MSEVTELNENFNYPTAAEESLSECQLEQSFSPEGSPGNEENEPVGVSLSSEPQEDLQKQGENPNLPSPSSEGNRPPAHATAAQLEALYSAGLSGDVSKVKALLEAATSSGDFETFALVNDASPRTGLTVVHAAASRGHVALLKWCMLLLV